MQTSLNPYIHFKDNTTEAMTFYQSVFGGKLDVAHFKDFDMPNDPADDDKVMHAILQADGITFMASDTPSHIEANPGFTINMALSGDDQAELREYFDKLSDGGQIAVPMDKAPWGGYFGMLTDKFGIEWLVNVSPQAD